MTKNGLIEKRGVLFGGLVVGALIQFNWAQQILLDKGLFITLYENWVRIIISSFAVSLLFVGISLLLKYIISIPKDAKIKMSETNIDSFLSFFKYAVIYFLFKPSEAAFIAIFLVLPVMYMLAPYINKEINKYKKSGLFHNLKVLYLLILAFQFSKEIILLFYRDPLFYYNYTGLLFSPLIYLLIPLLFPKIIKPYTLAVIIIFITTSFITFSHIFVYGTDIPPSAYYAIWETNYIEAWNYISEYFNFKSTISILLMLLFSVYILVLFKKIKNIRLSFLSRFVIAGLFFTVSFFTKSYSLNLPNIFFENYKQYTEELSEFKEQIEIRKNNHFKELKPIHCTQNDEQTLVIVIGESASKYHQGLYDYSRQTNPLLSEIKDELYIYKNVIAPHSHTNPVLSKVLSFANHEDMQALYENRSLIEYMNDAGYYTCWLSNQQFATTYTTISSSIGIQSDFYVFTHNNEDNHKGSYDGKLLKPFEIALKNKSKKKFIILHLMGSHSNKRDRYPVEFEKFTTWDGIPDKPYNSLWVKETINFHDNSVLYNDWVLRKFIDMLKAQNNNSLLLYFSDHGEEIYDYRDFMGHGEGNSSIYMFDIPFVLWMSERYKKQNHDKVQHFGKYLNRKYQTDDLMHSIIDLSGCYSDDYDERKSIFSPEFVFRKRIMGNKDYDKLIKTKKSITDK